MLINAIACDSLNSQLNLLSKGGFEGFQVDEFVSSDLSEQYLSVSNALINELLQAEMHISYSSIEEMISALNRPVFFDPKSDGAKYKLLLYLCSAIQSERLRLLKNAKQNTGRGRLVFQLDKICKVLNFPTTDLQNEIDVIEQIYQTVNALFEKSDNVDLMKNPAKILAHIRTLNEEQIRLTNNINEAYYADFQLRRQMLLKRLDVTVQSFLWSQKAGFDETEIKKAINSQLQYLSEQPRLFTVQDALAAPYALIHEHAKKVTGSVASASGSKSIVKQIIIGKVPDRGGRANEMRPKHFEVAGGYRGKNNHKNNRNDKTDKSDNKSEVKGASSGGGGSSNEKGGDGNNNRNNQKSDSKGKGGRGDQKQTTPTSASGAAESSNSKNDKKSGGSQPQLQAAGGGKQNKGNNNNKSGRVVTVQETASSEMDVVSPEVAALLAANEASASPSTGGNGGKGRHSRNNRHNKKARINN